MALLVDRKNWLFCGSVNGASSSVIVYSLVGTAKVNCIYLCKYLMLVLSMLPYLGKSPAHEELEKLMSWGSTAPRTYTEMNERQDPRAGPCRTLLGTGDY